MFFLRQPSQQTIQRFLSSQRELPFSYREIGATAGNLPAGYTVDRIAFNSVLEKNVINAQSTL